VRFSDTPLNEDHCRGKGGSAAYQENDKEFALRIRMNGNKLAEEYSEKRKN